MKSANGKATAALRREALVVAALDGCAFAARLLDWRDGDQATLVIEDLSAAHWPPPYPADTAALFDALDKLAEVAAPAGLSPAEDWDAGAQSRWSWVAADPKPFLGLRVCSAPWLERNIDALVAAESRVVVDGIDPQRHRGAALTRIGYVPQSPSLYRELTVDEHVRLTITLRPSFDPAYARQRLDDLGIPQTARAEQLSGGQQAQVGLALALGTRAPVLLLDEPLASLDPLARREFLHVLVDAVHADGTTALLSSHVITDIQQACDRLLVLGGGRTLLHRPIANALAEHRVIPAGEAMGSGRLVGTFPSPDNERLGLVTGVTDHGRPATLEEIVLGHLVAGRLPSQVPGSQAPSEAERVA